MTNYKIFTAASDIHASSDAMNRNTETKEQIMTSEITLNVTPGLHPMQRYELLKLLRNGVPSLEEVDGGTFFDPDTGKSMTDATYAFDCSYDEAKASIERMLPGVKLVFGSDHVDFYEGVAA